MQKRLTILFFLFYLLVGCGTMNPSSPTSTPQSSPLPQPQAGATLTPPAVEAKAPTTVQASAMPGPKTPQDYLATATARADFEFPLSQASRYQQPYREQYHFSPAAGWLGDPDGMVRFNNLYQLFWWGHAESKDLVHWNERLSPMIGDNGSFSYYSGSVVVDRNNTSGLAVDPSQPPMIAIYTMHDKTSNQETQGLSISYDYKSFVFYDQNPVLTSERPAFRDPQVFYYAPTQRWIMVIALSDDRKVSFYASPDLKHWEHLSDFGPQGAFSQVWEVPDLFQLSVDGDPHHKKWVLLCGMGPNREQYFIGDFDGQKFTLDPALNGFLKGSPPASSNGPERAAWLDYGADYYAVRTYRDYDNAENRVVSMGWLGNWEYANAVPTSWGKGALALPRELGLQTYPGGLRIIQRPIPALEGLRQAPVQVGQRAVSGVSPLTEFKPRRNTYEIDASFEITNPKAKFGIKIAVYGKDTYGVSIGYDAATSSLFLDRTNPEHGDFAGLFAKYMTAPLDAKDGKVRLHIFVDQSSIEVFANDGEVTMSALMFPGPESLGIELFSENGEATLANLSAWELDSIWGVPAR
ncbi:MAG: glycoside hydrolase family 32 protein [Anaerolineales bacterium]